MASLSISAALLAFGGGTLASGTQISDTAFNLGANIDALLPMVQQGLIAGISLTNGDTPLVVITPSQATTDAAVLALVSTPYNLGQRITAAAAGTTTLAAGFRNLSVVDTSANVVANLPAIEALFAKNLLGPVRLTDGGTPVLSMSAAVLAANVLALARITSAYTISLTDAGTASIVMPNWATSIGNYDGVIAKVTTPYTLTINGTVGPGFVAGIEDGVGRTSNSNLVAAPTNPIAPLGVVKTTFLPSNITVWNSPGPYTFALDALEQAALAGKLTAVQSYAGAGFGSAVLLTPAQYTADALAISKFDAGIPFAQAITAAQAANPPALDPRFVIYGVQDSAANILANIAALNTLARAGKLATVVPTDDVPYWTMTAAQFSLAVLPLSALVAVDNLVVTLTDPGIPTVTLPAEVFSLGVVQGNGLLYVANTYHLVITGTVSAATAANIANTSALKNVVTSVSVFDSASNIAGNIAALQTLATSGVLGSIQVSSGVAKLNLGAGAATTYAAALAKIASPYIVGTATTTPVSTTVSAFLAGLAGYEAQAEAGTLGAITFTDASQPSFTVSAATLQANYVAFTAISPFFTITLSDGGTPALTFAPWQLAQGLQGLFGIRGNFTFSVTGPVSAAMAASIATSGLGPNLSAPLAIADQSYNFTSTASNGTGLATLAALGKLGPITFLDSTGYSINQLVLTQTAATANAAVLAAVASPYELVLPVTAAQALTASLPSGAYVQMQVTDTPANIAANLDGLEKLAAGGQITNITVSGSNQLSLPVATVGADMDALELMYGLQGITLTNTGTINVHG